jgi:phosphate starvation-inducible protein PhoH and related proteins
LDYIPSPPDNQRLANLCGPLEANVRQLANALGVVINRRGEQFSIQGDLAASQQALEVLQKLYLRSLLPVEGGDVQLLLADAKLNLSKNNDTKQGPIKTNVPKPAVSRQTNPRQTPTRPEATKFDSIPAPLLDSSANQASPQLLTRRPDLQGRTPNQRAYLRNILSHDISFGIGPAGTGKTYLAVACAVDALERDLVNRIVLTRPAVEAGERLGFLPGDLSQKVDPYLRPLYDALYELMGMDKAQRMFEKQAIEVAPLAYMRGRTLNHSFIILDEAQNTTPEQMKMFLTRMGFGSKMVVTGDVTQIDLPKSQSSGLLEVRKILRHVNGLSFTEFDATDVVRHPLVARIVAAYEQNASQS